MPRGGIRKTLGRQLLPASLSRCHFLFFSFLLVLSLLPLLVHFRDSRICTPRFRRLRDYSLTKETMQRPKNKLGLPETARSGPLLRFDRLSVIEPFKVLLYSSSGRVDSDLSFLKMIYQYAHANPND